MHVLTGVTVVDLTVAASGPLCSRLLADWGARVVKVEPPRGDMTREWDSVCNGLSAAFVWLNRNKESIVVNLKTPEGQEIVRALVRRADVFLENFAPGVVDRLGLGYKELRSIKPDIVCCHISGYGPDGPYSDMKAFDLLVQGETGILEMTGTPESMAKVPLSICDIAAGMYAACAILAGIRRRDRTGEGVEIHVSMFDAIMDWLGYFPYFYWYRGTLPRRLGVRHHLLTPYGPYRASDGKYVNVAILTQEHWRLFCEQVIERPELLTDARYVNNEARIANRESLESYLEEVFVERPQLEWLERLRSAGIPCGRVNRLDEVLNHPVLRHSGQVGVIRSNRGPLTTMDNPVRWSTGRNRLDNVPDLGEHTLAVLRELGYSQESIQELTAKSVVGLGGTCQCSS